MTVVALLKLPLLLTELGDITTRSGCRRRRCSLSTGLLIRRSLRSTQRLQTRRQFFGLFIERLGALQQNLDFAGLVMFSLRLQDLVDLAFFVFRVELRPHSATCNIGD